MIKTLNKRSLIHCKQIIDINLAFEPLQTATKTIPIPFTAIMPIQTLLSQANRETEEFAQLALFEKVIELDPRQPEAVSNCARLWEQKGDRAFEQNDYENAS
jgi:hypothetical protein